MLEENFEDLRIKIIEKDKKRAEEIAMNYLHQL